MSPILHWASAADGSRRLFAGNSPHAIACGSRSRLGMWRYTLELPGSQHIAIATEALRDLAEASVTRWAAAWFAAVSA